MQTPVIVDRGRAAGSGANQPSKPALHITRRRLFRLTGGAGAAVAVVAVGGGVVRAIDQGVFSTGEGPAYAAWGDVHDVGVGDPLMLVRAAILAANAHNTQPWLFRVDASGIDLFADTTRGTGANDALGRELILSLGCALENLMVAAGPNGFAATPTLFPDAADPTHVARIDLAPTTPAVSALYDAIPDRHTNHAAFEDTPLAPETLAAMAGLNDAVDVAVVWLTSPEARQGFGEVTIAATEAFIADTEQSVDSFAWWRGDWDELQRRKDGITLDAAGLPSLTRALGKIMPDISRASFDDSWLKNTKDPQLSTAAAFGVIVARDHQSATQRLQSGRLYQRLHLWATVEGLAMQPINQTVERRDRELEAGLTADVGPALEELLAKPGWQAVMPFRIGYPKETPLKSPRRPAEDVVLA